MRFEAESLCEVVPSKKDETRKGESLNLGDTERKSPENHETCKLVA